MRQRIDVELDPHEKLSPDLETYVKSLVERLKMTNEVVKQNIEDCNFVTKTKYDKTAVDPNRYQLGDMVLMYDPTNKKGQCPKLKIRWAEPMVVVDKMAGGVLYKLKDSRTGKESRPFVHFTRIKPYRTDSTRMRRRK